MRTFDLPQPNPLIGTRYVAIVRTRQTGVARVPFAALAASGWDPRGAPPETLRVLRRGVELPVEQIGDQMRFVAAGSDSPYTTEASYWITSDGSTPGRRVPVLNTPTYPFVWEQDQLYQPALRSLRGDHWFAAEVRTGAAPFSTTLDLPSAAAAGSRLDLSLTPLVRRAGHTIVVSAGGIPSGMVVWSETPGMTGPVTITLTLARPVPAGQSVLELALVTPGAEADAVLIDRLALPGVATPLQALPDLAIDPPALDWDIRAGPAPGRPGADVLIIAHRSLRDTLMPLVAAKAALGRSAAIVDVQAAYDAFAWGERDPEAIRSLIRASADWPHAPRSVLLVGAGNVRLRPDAGEPDATLIPPYLVEIDPKYGERACDTCYTRLDSADPRADPLPDLAIGRLPARTPAEAQTLVARIIATLTAPEGGWRARALAIADNDREPDGAVDPAGPFTETAGQVLAQVPSGFGVQRFVYAPGDGRAGDRYADSAALRSALFTAWNEGAALLLYIGHASPWQWGATSPDEHNSALVGLYDIDRLSNRAHLPILLNLSCLSGDWANPTLPSIDERLLLHPGGGVAASLSPAGSGTGAGHRRFFSGVISGLFARTGGRTLGDAHRAGIARLAQAGHDLELAYTFNLLGDPDVALPFAPTGTIWMPLVPADTP
jgi:hypothetical protein